MRLINQLPSFMAKHADAIVAKLNESYLKDKYISAEAVQRLPTGGEKEFSLISTMVDIVVAVPDDITAVDAFEIGMFIGQCEILAQTGAL